MSEEANSEEVVLVEQRDRILIITINRPKAKNAVNAAVSRGLADAMDRLDGEDGLSVGILTGAGGSFCAGMDLKAFARGENVVVEGRGMGFTERPPVKPLIAAVEGYGLAGGMRAGAGHRPDRGVEGLGVRHPRGQARPGRGRRRSAAAAAAHPVRDRDGAGADR